MSERAMTIAVQSRRFSLLAGRPELLYPDAGQRTERVIADETKAPLDVMLLAGASEVDRVCAAAVATLSKDAPQAKPILALLAVLPPDYLLAVYFALPAERRRQCETDPVWAYHLRRIPDGVADAQVCLSAFLEADLAGSPEQFLDPEEAAGFRHFCDGLLRRALGMPHNLNETQVAVAEAGEELVGSAGD